MEEERMELPDTPETEAWQPRPLWQVWAARAGIVVFAIYVILQIILMFRGGM